MDKQKQLELASDLRNKLVELCTQFNLQAKYTDDLERTISSLGFLIQDLKIEINNEITSG
tara:strand:- start:315 stop:494 length:180 start_codon:yes stop_codon:yes gene_type:complete